MSPADEMARLSDFLSTMPCTCTCLCQSPPDPPAASPELLFAFAVLVLAAAALGFVWGRVRRIRKRLKLT